MLLLRESPVRSHSLDRERGEASRERLRTTYYALVHDTSSIHVDATMPTATGDLLQGTLAMLILKALLVNQSTHGYGIARWIEQTTGDVLRIEEGSLYPALRRIEDKGWVTSRWGVSENNRRARFYSITAAGREQLRAEGAVWTRYAAAVTSVMRAHPATT